MKTLSLILLFFLCQLLALLAFGRMAWALCVNPERAWLIARGYDLLGDVVFNDNQVQYISQRAQKAKVDGKRWGCWLCALLDKVQANHCENSVKP
jgi:hypothetical protein